MLCATMLLSVIATTSYSATNDATCNPSARVVACESTLTACDEALKRCAEFTQSQKETMALQGALLIAAEKKVARLQAERDSVWRNPLLWGLAGALLGLGGGLYLSR